MCGINGIISKEKDKDKLIKEMNKKRGLIAYDSSVITTQDGFCF